MKKYPLARHTDIHVYVTETKYLTPDDNIFEVVGASASAEMEYELTGKHEDDDDNLKTSAKELLEFIRPHACRRSLTTLFVQLGAEILKDFERIKDMPPLNERAKKQKDKFKEQYELLLKFLDKFEQI